MLKVAIVVLAGTSGAEALGRVVNALEAVKEFQSAGDDVRLLFDAAGTQWIAELTHPEHKYHALFQNVRESVTGICTYCANAFQVSESIARAELPLADEYEGHPSFRQLILDGYRVITF